MVGTFYIGHIFQLLELTLHKLFDLVPDNDVTEWFPLESHDCASNSIDDEDESTNEDCSEHQEGNHKGQTKDWAD